ncbi:MAG: ATPase central domain protein [Candidatus Eremiobacteraeota bacterium]|nr:ATPase central domain protein [Candidatus Eremiobacteraeota bacterium]
MSGAGWAVDNRDYLMAHVQRLRALVERDDANRRAADAALAACRARLEEPPALERVQSVFGLSPFECDVLVLCAGVHLDSAFADACAAQPRGGGWPSFGLALAAFPEAHWSALLPASPLRWWNLVTVDAPAGLAAGALQIDEWVLHVLAGTPYLDDRVAPFVTRLERPEELAPSHAALAGAIDARWNDPRGRGDVIELSGSDGAVKREIAAAAAAAGGLDAFVMLASDIPAQHAERAALARGWERLCSLFPAVLLIEAGDEPAPHAAAFVRSLRAQTIVANRAPAAVDGRRVARYAVTIATGPERVTALRRALGEAGASLNGVVDRVSLQFQLDSEQIATIGADLRAGPSARHDDDTVWEACRRVARPALDDLAVRIESSAEWDDIVLAAPQKAVLREIVTQTRERDTVYRRWGFGTKSSRGLGISALFSGASGTGKTLAAEVIANELRIDLYRIDLSATISKYIGETEKNLRRIFDAADRGGAVLLFDEADALFGKRSEVRDSHDRYANVEISYLLQRMEAYSGLAILTTNLKTALDTAFLRRLRFIVHFGFPDAAERKEIWRRVFPASLPTKGLDYEQLARLNVSGGTIRNIALGAAFLAAADGGPLRMAHIARAVRSEFIKLEQSFSETEIAQWR